MMQHAADWESLLNLILFLTPKSLYDVLRILLCLTKKTSTLNLCMCFTAIYHHLLLQAGKHHEAVKLLTDQAQKLTAAKGSPLHIKQLHVLAALEVEAFRKQTLEGAGGDNSTAAATLLNAGRGGPGTTSMVTGAAAPTAAAATLAGRERCDGYLIANFAGPVAGCDGAKIARGALWVAGSRGRRAQQVRSCIGGT